MHRLARSCYYRPAFRVLLSLSLALGFAATGICQQQQPGGQTASQWPDPGSVMNPGQLAPAAVPTPLPPVTRTNTLPPALQFSPNANQQFQNQQLPPAQVEYQAPLTPTPATTTTTAETAPAPTPAEAPTEADTAEVLRQQAKDTAAEAKSTLVSAFKGDRGAQQAVFLEYLLPAVVALLMLIVGYMVASFVGRITGELVSSRVDLTLGKFAGRMTRNLILLMVILGVLSYFSIDITSIAAILAAASFAVGMALQGTLSNFAAGVMLLVFRPFKVNDYIKVAGIEGTVDEIDLFTTKMDTLDNRRLIVPNSEVFGSTIENCTRNEIRRVDVNVGVDYAADLRQTRQVLSNGIAVIPGAVTRPEPEVYLMELADSSVNWQLRVWCRPENYWDVRQRVTMAAKDALDAANISIPFPQMDLHVVSGVENPVKLAA